MRNKYKLFIAGALMMAMGSCKKQAFLNRAPLSDISPQTFFVNEADLQLYCNQYYNNLPVQTFLRADDQSDDKANSSINSLLAGTYTVPASISPSTVADLVGTASYITQGGLLQGSGTNWNYVLIRRCNFFLANYQVATVSDSIKNMYVAETLFFRANDFWKKVKTFGDVPYINKYITDTSTSYLYGP